MAWGPVPDAGALLLLLALVSCAAADFCSADQPSCRGRPAALAHSRRKAGRQLQGGGSPGGGSSPGGGGSPSGGGGSSSGGGGGGGGGSGHQCVDTDHGALNSRGDACPWYHDAQFACEELDDADFNATEMCCACKERSGPPTVDPNCHNTNHYAADVSGYTCSVYEDHEFCGFSDTPYFQAKEMCCLCGGGVSGAVCPYSALRAEPDNVSGLCECGPSHVCTDFDNPGRGCPAAPGTWSTTFFNPGCGSCRCVREEERILDDARFKTCDHPFEETWMEDTTEAWMVFAIMGKVREQIHVLARAMSEVVKKIVTAWDMVALLDGNRLREERELLQELAAYFYASVDSSGYSVRSCGLYLVSGEFASVENGGCASPEDQVFLTNINNERRLQAFKLHGVDECDNSLLRTCFFQTVWPEGWSNNDTKTVYQLSNGSWAYGIGVHDPRNEAWLQYAYHDLYDKEGVLYVGRWSSHVDRESQIGMAYWLDNPSTLQRAGIVKCSIAARSMSEFLRTQVGAGIRLFMSDPANGLVAASHGEVEIPAEPDQPFPRMLGASESSDPVIRKVGTWLDANRQGLLQQVAAGLIRFPHSVLLDWPEMHATLGAYAFYGGYKLNTWVIFVNAPRCYPGRQMAVNSSSDIANCEECPAGRVSERGATLGSLCRECRPGFFSSATGARECQTCERGTYQDERSSTECKACPENTTSYPGSQNLTSCRCMSGYFSPSGVAGIACSPCPLGHQCIGEEMAPFAKEKYYGISQQVCIKCVSTMDSTPCLGGAEGGSSVGTLCKDGYEGVGCSHCSEGFFRFGRDCLECSPGEDWLMVYWVGLIIIFYLMRRVVNSKYKTLYIFLSFLQVFGLQGSFSLGWSARIKHTMRIIQVANLQVDLLMPSCEREINYPYKYLMYLVLPWFFLLVDMVVIFLNRLLKAMTSRGKGKKEPKEQVQEPAKLENADRAEEPGQSRAEGEDPGQLKTAISSLSEAVRNKPVAIAGTFADVAGINKRSSKDLLYDFLGQALVNMRLMYLSLCGRTLDMLQCTDMGEGLPPRLSKDMDLVCWDGLHSSFMPIVGIAGVFYIVGTPLAYIVILYRGYRSNTLYSREHVRRYGLLYSRFEPSFFFWELVIMLRRVLAVAIKTLLNIRTAEYQQSGYIGNYQAALTCSVMVIALALHFYARPFCNPFLDFGDAVFLGGTFLSCIIGICFSTARNETEYEAMELLFFLNLGLICTVAAALLYRDVEAVHPRVKRLRAKLAALLRCHVMYEWLRSRFHSQLRRKKAEATELVSGIKFEQLQQKPVLLRVFKSVLCHSVHEKLEDLGIEPDHIQVIMTPGDAPQTVLVRTIIVPPSGISPELVQIAMNNHSQAELVHSLMGGMMEAIASRTPPDKPPSVTI